jgi:hypothetical protein
MLKALLPAIMKLFAYLLVLHLSIDSLLLPARREYSVSRLEGTRECNLCAHGNVTHGLCSFYTGYRTS